MFVVAFHGGDEEDEDEADGAGDPVALLDFWCVFEEFFRGGDGFGAVGDESVGDADGDGVADGGGIEDGDGVFNDAFFFEFGDAALDGGGGEGDFFGDFALGKRCVFLEEFEDVEILVVERASEHCVKSCV